MLKYKWLLLIASCLFITAHAKLKEPPPPYNSLEKLYPFVDHGWYQNGKQLHELIEKHSIRTIVEIGVWLGQSTLDLARHIPWNGKVYAVDHFLGSTEHQPGYSAWHPCLPYLYEQFLSNVIHARLTHKIVPMRMNSWEASYILKDLKPDMVYIDASHETEAVYQNLCTWFPFVKGNGILCGDDWLWLSVQVAVNQFAQENNLVVLSSGNFWRLAE